VIFKLYLEKECLMMNGSESSGEREKEIEGRGRE